VIASIRRRLPITTLGAVKKSAIVRLTNARRPGVSFIPWYIVYIIEPGWSVFPISLVCRLVCCRHLRGEAHDEGWKDRKRRRLLEMALRVVEYIGGKKTERNKQDETKRGRLGDGCCETRIERTDFGCGVCWGSRRVVAVLTGVEKQILANQRDAPPLTQPPRSTTKCRTVTIALSPSITPFVHSSVSVRSTLGYLPYSSSGILKSKFSSLTWFAINLQALAESSCPG
jgi:hypothetical protein